MIDLRVGDCREVLAGMAADSVDACVTDPPYHLTTGKKGGSGEAFVNLATPYGRSRVTTGFMGQTWDGGDVAFQPETWAEVLRVLKPGAHLFAFGGTRTYHRLVCAIEDAGFEIRDQFAWLYGQGFPKSMDAAKAVDKALGREGDTAPVGAPVKRMIPGADQNATGSWINDNGREYQPGVYAPATPEAAAWQGWGTAMKPALEPIVLARKPLIGTVAANLLAHGVGALNIDANRIEGEPWKAHRATGLASEKFFTRGDAPEINKTPHELGRWPANVIHDGSPEVLAAFPDAPGQLRAVGPQHGPKPSVNVYGDLGAHSDFAPRGDAGSAARFFYCAKASRSDRGEGNTHPTVKPQALMRHLVRLITPPGGVVLDPFAGSGTTGLAARDEGFDSILVEMMGDHAAIIRKRLGLPGVSGLAADSNEGVFG